MIKVDKEIKVFLVVFESSNICKSYDVEKGIVKTWRKYKVWCKINIQKTSKISKVILKMLRSSHAKVELGIETSFCCEAT